jgi:hypothetical protein
MNLHGILKETDKPYRSSVLFSPVMFAVTVYYYFLRFWHFVLVATFTPSQPGRTTSTPTNNNQERKKCAWPKIY